MKPIDLHQYFDSLQLRLGIKYFVFLLPFADRHVVKHSLIGATVCKNAIDLKCTI